MAKRTARTGMEPFLSSARTKRRQNEVRLGGDKALLHIIECLQDTNAGVRERATMRLAEMGHPDAFEELLHLLEEPKLRVRLRALQALSRLNDPRVFDTFQERLNDKYEFLDLRLAAMEMLVSLGDPRASDVLVRYTQDREGDRKLRSIAVRELPNLRDPRSVAILRTLVVDPDEDMSIRRVGAEVLGKMGDTVLLEDLLKQASIKNLDVVPLIGLLRDARAVPHLLNILRQLKLYETEETWLIATALAEIGDASAVPLLLKRLPLGGVAEALGKLRDPRAVDPLLAKLREQRSYQYDHPIEIIEALGQFDDPRIIDELMLEFTGSHQVRQRAVVRAFANMDSTRAVPALLEALSLTRGHVRVYTLEALGHFSLSELGVCHAVIAALEDESRIVRVAAARILGQHRETEAVGALVRHLRTDHKQVQGAVRYALHQIGTPEALAAIRREKL